MNSPDQNYPHECPVLDPDGPYRAQLTPEEIVALRRIIKDAEHASWLRKQIFVVVPVVFAVVAVVTWAANNLTLKH